MNKPYHQPKGTVKVVLFMLFVMFFMFLLYANYVKNPFKTSQREKDYFAIEYCWDNYKKHIGSYSEKEIIAGSCKILEDRFREKYGVDH